MAKWAKNQPVRNKNCLWWPCLLMDRDKMSNLHRGPSIDASYHVSVHLGNGFQRRRLKCEKLTDDRRRTPSDGKSSHCLWQGDLKTNQNKNLISPFFSSFQTQHFWHVSSIFTDNFDDTDVYQRIVDKSDKWRCHHCKILWK